MRLVSPKGAVKSCRAPPLFLTLCAFLLLLDTMSDAVSSQAESMRVVCQRVTSGRLLVNAEQDRWAAVPSPGGLVFLTGFQVEKKEVGTTENDFIDAERLKRAAHSLLGAPLACGHENGWQEDHSETIPVAGLVSSGRRVCITMIPQACLAGVIPIGQKSVKYNRQVDKNRARELWLQWVVSVVAKLCELVRPPTEEELAAARKAEAAAKMKAKAAEAPANPCIMFKEGSWAGKFGAFADDGMPLTEAETGEPVSKSQLKKLQRIHAQQKDKWERYASKQGEEEAASKPEAAQADAQGEQAPDSAAQSWPDWLKMNVKEGGAVVVKADGSVGRLALEEAAEEGEREGERARLVWGTFGGRQSWEAKSTGPFTHAVNF